MIILIAIPSISFIRLLLEPGSISKDRLIAYMEKAAREAKQRTSWTQPNKEFEDALKTFIERILESREFVSELDSLWRAYWRRGASTA